MRFFVCCAFDRKKAERGRAIIASSLGRPKPPHRAGLGLLFRLAACGFSLAGRLARTAAALTRQWLDAASL